jgi:dTDP-4-dehydrorhamnose reductase
MLGQALIAELLRRRRAHVAPDLDRLDLLAGDPGESVAALRPAAVINASGFTDVAQAEREENRVAVERLNHEAPGELARACRRLGIPLVHVSTDFVFDGTATRPYREQDSVAPLQCYGSSKLRGERAVLETFPRALVVRTSTLFGPGRPAQRPHYVDAILRQARQNAELRVVRLPISSPTYSLDLARGMVDLLECGASGLVHLVNRGACSRLELAAETVRQAGLGERVRLDERAEPRGGLARPAYSALDTSRFAAVAGYRPPAWQEALGRYLASRLPSG